MKEKLRRIVIVTRPKETLGYYEYFMDTRRRRFILLPSKEPGLFEQALKNISEGKNPSDWVLTRPSEKDFGIKITPVLQNCFYRWEDDIYYFPNDNVKNEWFDWHWKEYELEEDSEISDIHGVKVKRIVGTVHSD